MIVFWTTRRNTVPITACLASMMGSAFERASLGLVYEDWIDRSRERWLDLADALHVFTDIEFLSGQTAARVKELHAFFSGRGRVLNHPERSLKRLALHRRLHAEGINEFQSFAFDDAAAETVRFPVFMRRANDHAGSLTGLLSTPAELTRKIEALRRTNISLRDWIITEYAETAGERGIRHKFGAFNIAGTIIPRHLFFSHGWVIKEAGQLSAELMAEERAYLETNPHEEWIRRVFDMAGIQYGRIDYSLVNGKPQVWEINTNPMVFQVQQRWGPRADHHRRVRARIERAWADLDALSPLSAKCQIHKVKTYPALSAYLAESALRSLPGAGRALAVLRTVKRRFFNSPT